MISDRVASEGEAVAEGDVNAPVRMPGFQRIARWALERVASHLRRYGYRLMQPAGGPSGMFVSVDEARAVLDGTDGFDLARSLGLEPPPDSRALDPPPAALDGLADRLGLTPLHIRLLLAALAPHLSGDIARLYTFAVADFTRKTPPAGFLAELVTDGPAAAAAAHAAFRPDSPLRVADLLRLIPESPLDADAPPDQLGVRVPAAVVAWVRGEPPPLSADLAAAIDPPPGPRLGGDRPDPNRIASIRALLASPAPRLLLVGERGVGRRRALCAALVPATPLTVDLDHLPVEPDQLYPLLAEAARIAALYDRALLLRADGLLANADDPRLPTLARLIRRHRGPLALTARNAAGALHARVDLRPVYFTLPDAHRQRDLWAAALAAEGDERLADTALSDRLVQRFTASPGAIDAAVREGRAHARLDDRPLDLDHIAAALRRRIHHALDTVAEPSTTTLTWDDVVLPSDVVDTLREIRSQARHRLKVFDDWGFRRKLAYGRGLACLFAGPPGTGKTMMAGILARDLGRELYRVDLSRLVSKWVGETEKNLALAFDEAERAQVILFFDEADSLFSTRTEVKGANDRFANMEVNYLLQRMESFDGVTILTTNFERSLDDAFKRRLRFRVHFPLPDAAERAKLWARMIPAQMPTADEIDFERLGKSHKLSGGAIKNAVLRAAFYVAEEGGVLTGRLLRRAAEAEARELGRL